VHIAFSTLAALGNDKIIFIFGEIPKHLPGICISYLSSHRDEESAVLSALASLLFAAADGAPIRFELTLEMKIQEGLLGTCGFYYYITAFATISAIRAASGHVLFAAETDTSFPAVSSPDVDFDLINKTHGQR
jgi:hypothetical protein